MKKIFTETNIKKGLSATGIYPLNQAIVDAKLTPSENFYYFDKRINNTIPVADDAPANNVGGASGGGCEYPSTILLEEEPILDDCNSKEDDSEAFSFSDVVEPEEEIS